MRLLPKSGPLSRWFERIYKIGVAIKGIDGLIEFGAGVALLISPHLVHVVLGGVAAEMGEHHAHVFQFIAEYVGRLDDNLAKSGLAFLIIFLISHGLVKLVLVYCLLREYVRVYPYALVILIGFLVYQLYVLIAAPTIGMGIFTLLDIIIIYLVWGEWRELRAKK